MFGSAFPLLPIHPLSWRAHLIHAVCLHCRYRLPTFFARANKSGALLHTMNNFAHACQPDTLPHASLSFFLAILVCRSLCGCTPAPSHSICLCPSSALHPGVTSRTRTEPMAIAAYRCTRPTTRVMGLQRRKRRRRVQAVLMRQLRARHGTVLSRLPVSHLTRIPPRSSG